MKGESTWKTVLAFLSAGGMFLATTPLSWTLVFTKLYEVVRVLCKKEVSHPHLTIQARVNLSAGLYRVDIACDEDYPMRAWLELGPSTTTEYEVRSTS